jgi:phage gp36-like protein
MKYLELADLVTEFSEEELVLLTDGTLPNTFNDGRINMAADKVGAIIDSKLKSRYSVPFTDPPPFLIRKIAYDLIVNNLYEMNEQTTAMPSTILRRKNEAEELLSELAAGTIIMYDEDYEGVYPNMIISNKSGEQREFSSVQLENFK